MENPFQDKTYRQQRPTFLLVLCILTFIGSGWSVLSNLFSVFTAGLMNGNIQIEQYSSMINEIQGSGISAFWQNFFHSSIEVLKVMAIHAREIAIMQLVLNIVSLVGAILMFQLRRFGFYLYTPAQVLLLFIYPYFAGFSGLVVLIMCWLAFFSLLFIILYALNLKYMK